MMVTRSLRRFLQLVPVRDDRQLCAALSEYAGIETPLMNHYTLATLNNCTGSIERSWDMMTAVSFQQVDVLRFYLGACSVRQMVVMCDVDGLLWVDAGYELQL